MGILGQSHVGNFFGVNRSLDEQPFTLQMIEVTASVSEVSAVAMSHKVAKVERPKCSDIRQGLDF